MPRHGEAIRNRFSALIHPHDQQNVTCHRFRQICNSCDTYTVEDFEQMFGQRFWETDESSYDYLVKVSRGGDRLGNPAQQEIDEKVKASRSYYNCCQSVVYVKLIVFFPRLKHVISCLYSGKCCRLPLGNVNVLSPTLENPGWLLRKGWRLII